MMKNNQEQPDLQRSLLKLGLNYLGTHLSDFVSQSTTRKLSNYQILEEICRIECADQEQRRVERRIRDAKIGRFKMMADFDWAWPRHIERDSVDRAMQLEFMREKSNIILVGPQGVGKTMIARNVAHSAALAGYSVKYITASALVVDLASQDSARSLSHRLSRYSRIDLLVIDECGYLMFDARSADLLFAVVNQRYEAKPIILTTNLAFSDWGSIFPGAACVTAMIDRLTHHADIIGIDAESYRHRESKENHEKRKQNRRKKAES